MKEENSRIRWLDRCKGLAIILVVIGHVADGYLGANFFEGRTILLR